MSSKPRVGKPVGATAIVTLTVRIQVPSSWGPDCTVAQIHRQAGESAVGMLRNANITAGRLEIVGAPEVKTVITER